MQDRLTWMMKALQRQVQRVNRQQVEQHARRVYSPARRHYPSTASLTLCLSFAKVHIYLSTPSFLYLHFMCQSIHLVRGALTSNSSPCSWVATAESDDAEVMKARAAFRQYIMSVCLSQLKDMNATRKSSSIHVVKENRKICIQLAPVLWKEFHTNWKAAHDAGALLRPLLHSWRCVE
jgi:hypothetical protein